jgi:cobyrinic acid a,c-diamide synthase
MAASAAALVRGFETFDPVVRIAGVVFNQLGSAGHYGLLRDALAQAGCAPTVGYLPKEASIRIPERHLDLYTAHEDVLSKPALDQLSSLMEQFVDLDRVLEIAAIEDEYPTPVPTSHREREVAARIAVARDGAFCFYYEDNLDALRAAGAEIVVPMVGVLPFGTMLTDRLVRFGYTEVSFTSDCLLGRAGATARGHGFHFSTIDGAPDVDCVYRLRSTRRAELSANFARAAQLSRIRSHTV